MRPVYATRRRSRLVENPWVIFVLIWQQQRARSATLTAGRNLSAHEKPRKNTVFLVFSGVLDNSEAQTFNP